MYMSIKIFHSLQNSCKLKTDKTNLNQTITVASFLQFYSVYVLITLARQINVDGYTHRVPFHYFACFVTDNYNLLSNKGYH